MAPISLQDLLSKIHYSDPTVAPGQYWYTSSVSALGGTTDGITDETITTWRPADWTGEWQRHRTMSDAHKFTYANGVVTMGPTQELGLPIDQTMWAGCGDFSQRNAPLNATHLPCDKNREAPTFDWPTPDWVAGLSTNPADILAQLTIGQQGRPPLSLPIRALTTGVFTAKARAAIYQAVAMMPGVYGLQNVPNPDGKIGYALGVHLRGGTNDELLIDPTDGTYLGERTYDPKTGAVTKFSSMRYGVADAEGAMPK